MSIQHRFRLNRSFLRCLVFVGVAFAVALAVILLKHAFFTVGVILGIALGAWQLWEREQQRISSLKTEQLAQVEQQYQASIKALQTEFNEISNQRETGIQEILSLNKELEKNKLKYQSFLEQLDIIKAENLQLKASLKASEELLDEAIAHEKKTSLERKYLLFKIQQLANKVKQRTTERNLDRLTLQNLREQFNHLSQQIPQLEQELRKYRETASSNQPTRELTSRPFNMDDMRFAKIALIKLEPLPDPKTLLEETERHYHQRNGGFDPSPITLNSISEYLRHRYSNYDDLCREFGSYNEKARNVLKCRVNTTIWMALSSLDLQLED